MRKWKAPADLDRECFELCASINETFTSIQTTESCCGHGKEPFSVWMDVRRGASRQLACLLYCIDDCHVGVPGWQCIVRADCMFGGPFYSIVGPVGDYAGARKIAAFIRSAPWSEPPPEAARRR